MGVEVTFNPDGSFVQQSGNSGTWECTDPAQRLVTLRWQQGGFVNQLVLSADGTRLSSTNQSPSFISATGSFPLKEGNAVMRIGDKSITLKTQPDGARQLPKDLPQLLHAVTRQARSWRTDTIPVSLEAQERKGPIQRPCNRSANFSTVAFSGHWAAGDGDGRGRSHVGDQPNRAVGDGALAGGILGSARCCAYRAREGHEAFCRQCKPQGLGSIRRAARSCLDGR